jgi:thiol-disulfide isomerase/thioredoxin
MDRRTALLAGMTALAFGGPAVAKTNGKVRAPYVGTLAGAVAPSPYNETADAHADVAAAVARAKAKKKLLLIDFGGNWCPDCRALAATIELPKAKPFIAKYYELVYVDVGRKDKNLDIAAQYGIANLKGVPAIAVVAPDGRILNQGREFVLTTAKSWGTQAVIEQLADWIA